MTKEDLGKTLLKFFDGDTDRTKKFVSECESIGFKLGDNLDSIEDNQPALFTLATLSEFGMMDKLIKALNMLQGK